jgi:hypothetical protein
MCIACELGYWAMIDALEAERASQGKAARVNETKFICDAPVEPPKRKPDKTFTDERTP